MVESSTVPVKPILMCFVCKLSFGVSSSFVSHCVGEHNVKLSDEEKVTLSVKNSSAILQLVTVSRNLFSPSLMKSSNKLECLSIAVLSNI
jgi:hypothetical protein